MVVVAAVGGGPVEDMRASDVKESDLMCTFD